MLNTERIAALARVLDGSPVTELILAEGETEIRLVRVPTQAPQSVVAVEPSGTEELPRPHEHIIEARRVGVYHKPARDIQVGDWVQPGDIVGFIEALRLSNEVVAETGGMIAQIFVEDGSPVEYGQELLLLSEVEDETA